jgi:hypothetical protein
MKAPFTKTRQQAHRVGLASIDMTEARSYLTAYEQLAMLQENDDTGDWYDACKGLLCAAIVTYCRPFSDNKSIGFAAQRLRAKEFASVKELRALHDLLILKRNTFIAHADWSARSATILNAVPGAVSWQFPQPNVWEGLDVKEFRHLIESLFNECLDKGVELAKAAEQEEAAK